MWDLIVLIPAHYIFIYFPRSSRETKKILQKLFLMKLMVKKIAVYLNLEGLCKLRIPTPFYEAMLEKSWSGITHFAKGNHEYLD